MSAEAPKVRTVQLASELPPGTHYLIVFLGLDHSICVYPTQDDWEDEIDRLRKKGRADFVPGRLTVPEVRTTTDIFFTE